MNHWNYRVMEVDDLLQIHEVYYDSKGKVTYWAKEPTPVLSEDVKGLKFQLKKMKEALKKPILDEVKLTKKLNKGKNNARK